MTSNYLNHYGTFNCFLDLDTVASSIAFAWIRTGTQNIPTIPFIQTDRSDIGLRAENIYALSLAGVQGSELLCAGDFPWTEAFPSNTFALVDHNRLLPQYSIGNSDVKVVAVVDHHEDEGLYKDSATPRIITPAGSCASHIAHLCHPPVPAGVASLLLSAILIDTQGLKAGGKALDVDREAAAFLISQATSSLSPSPVNPFPLSQGHAFKPDEVAGLQFIRDLTAELDEKKNDVSRLGTRDLIRRDYKQSRINLPWVSNGTYVNSGLSTVPVDLKSWIPRNTQEFWSSVKAWMEQRKLSVLGILTSFHDEKKPGESGKGKHKRQMLWVVREGEIVDDTQLEIDSSKIPQKFNVEDLASRLWAGLEASEELELKRGDLEKFGISNQDVHSSMRIRIYKQGNASASRKVTAPLLKNILESV